MDKIKQLIESVYGEKNGQIVHLWTTFSADQIDFNFKSLDVLEKMIEVLLFYVRQGANILRLEGILPKKEINGFAEIVKSNGGQVSYKKKFGWKQESL